MPETETKDTFVPLGIVECPNCKLSSLSWNMVCARCNADLFPNESDNVDRHKQENAA